MESKSAPERAERYRARGRKRNIHGVSEKFCKIVSIRTSSNFYQF